MWPSTKQSDLVGKVFLCPLFCFSLPWLWEEQDTQIPFFMYSHPFYHITLDTEVSTQSPVLLPPVCMQVNKCILPQCHDSVSFCITFCSPRPLPLFISFHWLTCMLKGKEGGRNQTLALLDMYCIHYTCHTRSHSTQPSDLLGDERGGKWRGCSLIPPAAYSHSCQSLILLPLCWIWSRRIGSVWSLATFLLPWMLWATRLHFVQHSQWESNVESVGFFNQHLHCFSLWQYTDLSV